mmetsp:Transcript_24437/g.43339  ORF Transcript_24437/g.43339 Transcript_24437/m.43339 type:complete len:215 (+) Transcript_24437:45-689(+)
MVEAEVAPQFQMKILLTGKGGVGKTSLRDQFVKNTFREDRVPTLGVEFLNKSLTVNETTVRAQVWDTAGQEFHKALSPIYFRGASGALLIFSVTERESLECIDRWITEISTYSGDIPTILIGNKSDLINERVIPTDEGQRFAKERGLAYMETSAKTASNVQQAFERLVEKVLSSKVQTLKKTETPKTPIQSGNKIDTTPIALKPAEPKPKKKCC